MPCCAPPHTYLPAAQLLLDSNKYAHKCQSRKEFAPLRDAVLAVALHGHVADQQRLLDEIAVAVARVEDRDLVGRVARVQQHAHQLPDVVRLCLRVH
jgi:hypothetical protein